LKKHRIEHSEKSSSTVRVRSLFDKSTRHGDKMFLLTASEREREREIKIGSVY
jgi:hypothetical protein